MISSSMLLIVFSKFELVTTVSSVFFWKDSATLIPSFKPLTIFLTPGGGGGGGGGGGKNHPRRNDSNISSYGIHLAFGFEILRRLMYLRGKNNEHIPKNLNWQDYIGGGGKLFVSPWNYKGVKFTPVNCVQKG